VVAVALLLAGCGLPDGPPAPPPSDLEARNYLRAVVDVVLAGNLGELCRLGSGTCQQTLDRSDPAAVPRTPPVVVGSHAILPSRRADGRWDAGGRLIQVCGLDGRGQPYASEILVFSEGGRLIGTEPVFWTGLRVARDPAVGPPPAPFPCPPPS
jgi:hypothetical protein